MFSTREYGSLAIVEETWDKRRINDELQRIDRALFLDAEVDPKWGRLVWCVKVHIGSETPPHLVFQWRDEAGAPLALSSGLIEEVKKIEHRISRGRSMVQVAQEANDARTASVNKSAEEAYAEIAEDVARKLHPVHSAVLPRSQALRMSRDKKRAKGWKA